MRRCFVFMVIMSLIWPVTSLAQETSTDAPAFAALTSFSTVNPTVKIVSYDANYHGGIFSLQSGSATIIRNDGIILTNNHVVEDQREEALDAFEICFTTDQNKDPICEYTASLVARSKEYDLAILKINQRDIRGNAVFSLPFFDYQTQTDPKVEDKIKTIGYPDIGRTTITTTQGAISGFSDVGTVKYIKLDAKISSGNSGGTMIDGNNNFIGVPSAGDVGEVSQETLGYAIDLRSVRPWITEHINDEPIKPIYNEILSAKKMLLNDSNSNHALTYPFYPRFSLKTDSSWQFNEVEKTGVSLSALSNERDFDLSISVQHLPFPVAGPYLDKIFERIEKNKEDFTNYKREDSEIGGVKASKITFNAPGTGLVYYIIPYGYGLLQLGYHIDLQNSSRDQKKFDELLSTWKFLDKEETADPMSIYKHPMPDFSVGTAGNFKIQPTEEPNDKYTILDWLLQNNFEGKIALKYLPMDEAFKDLSLEKILDKSLESLKYRSGFTLINKDYSVMIDGLPGWSLTYGYEGEEYQKSRKVSELFLRDGDFFFSIVYDDLEPSYNENLVHFQEILKSFKTGQPLEKKGTYDIGSLDYGFKDIVNHRFIVAISDLKDKEIISGYEDGTFGPEKNLMRSEALKMILDSKLYNKDSTLDKRAEIQNYKSGKYIKFDFKDNKQTDWYSRYIRYARDKKIVAGYSDGKFQPNNNISLAEVLAILFKTYEIKIWQPPAEDTSVAWFKPYMDKAFELRILSADMTDPHHLVTRGEFAYIINTLMTNVEESF